MRGTPAAISLTVPDDTAPDAPVGSGVASRHKPYGDRMTTIVKLTLEQVDGVAIATTGEAQTVPMPGGLRIEYDGTLSLNGYELRSPLALRSEWVARGVSAQARALSLAGPVAANPEDGDAASAYGEAAGELDACERMVGLFDRCEAGEFGLRDFGDVARNEPHVSTVLAGESPALTKARADAYARVTSSLTANVEATARYEWEQW